MCRLKKITIKDLIVLGTAVPDETSDHRKTVCLAGYSPEHGLVRVYPVPPQAVVNRWSCVEIPLEQNPQDTRKESWKIQGSQSEWSHLQSKIQHHGTITRKQQVELVHRLHNEFGVGCIQDLNIKRQSLGLIKPSILECKFTSRENYERQIQTNLDCKIPFLTIHNYDIQPRMTYQCSNCKQKNPHDQQILEWGIYEWMRKNPNNKDQIWENLKLYDSRYDISFLVGNMARYRNSFLIVSIFRFKTSQ